MDRLELEAAIRGLIGPRYWVMEELMALVDQYRDSEVWAVLNQHDTARNDT